MFCSQYTEAIQELADGTLGPVRRAELQTHLDLCDDCRALAADLRKIRESAADLGAVAPPDRVWLRIAGQLRDEQRVAAGGASRPRGMAMLAIAASLLLAVGGSLYMLRNVSPQRPADAPVASTDPAGNATTRDPVQSINDDLTAAIQHYESAIAKLEQAVKSDKDAIDPEVAAVIQKNVPVIDQAIAATKSALQSEPQSAPAREGLFDALRKKVSLLQDTIALMNEMRKGNSAGAAQLVDGGNKS